MNETSNPPEHTPLSPNPAPTQTTVAMDVASLIDVAPEETDELAFVKKTGDFYVEFFETDKKARVKNSEVASSLLVTVSVEAIYPEVKSKPGRKKKNPVEVASEPEAWRVVLSFHDDTNNDAKVFVQSLLDRESSFKLRIIQTNASDDPVEAFLLKECQAIDEMEHPYLWFDASNNNPRYVRLSVRAETLVHKFFGA